MNIYGKRRLQDKRVESKRRACPGRTYSGQYFVSAPRSQNTIRSHRAGLSGTPLSLRSPRKAATAFGIPPIPCARALLRTRRA